MPPASMCNAAVFPPAAPRRCSADKAQHPPPDAASRCRPVALPHQPPIPGLPLRIRRVAEEVHEIGVVRADVLMPATQDRGGRRRRCIADQLKIPGVGGRIIGDTKPMIAIHDDHTHPRPHATGHAVQGLGIA